jgi:hypothetical protein
MIIKTHDGLEIELEEDDIRRWFMAVPLEQAQDTFRVVEGIIQMRTEAQPARKRRKDAGTKRETVVGNSGTLYDEPLDLRELGK